MFTLQNRSQNYALLIVAALVNCHGGCGPGLDLPNMRTVCESDLAPPTDGAEAATVGETSTGLFRPLSSEDQLELEFGPQGGQHFFAAVRFFAQDGQTWTHELALLNTDNPNELGGRVATAEDPCVPGWNRTENIQVFVDSPTTMEGRLVVEAQLRDSSFDQVVRRVYAPEIKVSLTMP